MANFSYQAISESGATVSGAIEADSVEMAENILLSRGYIPAKVTAAAQAGSGSSFLAKIKESLSKVKIGDLILFTKQFRSMMQAGVPILRLLQVLENQTENKVIKGAVGLIGQDIRAGATLHEAMKKHPAIFSSLYLNMINAGEVSGTVPDILGRLTGIIEHEAKVKSDIKSALQYPMVVLIALGVAFFVLLTFVIPKFVSTFAKAGLTLPLPTKIAMLMYQGLANYWYILIGGGGGPDHRAARLLQNRSRPLCAGRLLPENPSLRPPVPEGGDVPVCQHLRDPAGKRRSRVAGDGSSLRDDRQYGDLP